MSTATQNTCIFIDLFGCKSKRDKLIYSGDRYPKIKTASANLRDNISRKIDDGTKNGYKLPYHGSCACKYILAGDRAGKRPIGEEKAAVPSPKKTRANQGKPFDQRMLCLFCGKVCILTKDPKNPNRWREAYNFRETEKGIEKNIELTCTKRADQAGKDVSDRLSQVLTVASDLHAADACYHQDCRTRFSNMRALPGI